jgi:hypothetical protein
MIDVKIRYNTLCDDNKNYWRILIDGTEFTCEDIKINIPVHTTRDIVFDQYRNCEVDKHHISCTANSVKWDGDKVTII